MTTMLQHGVFHRGRVRSLLGEGVQQQSTSTTHYAGAEHENPRHRGAGRLHIPARSVFPSARAILGGLLITVAAVGTFTAWRQASGLPDTTYVTARQPLESGHRLSEGDLDVERIALPGALAQAAFTEVDDVVGRVTLGPIGEGELLQVSQVSDAAEVPDPHVEVSFTLPRDRAVDGRLRSGDRIDVFVTRDDITGPVLERVQVIAITDGGGSSLVSGTDVTITIGLEDPTRRTDLIHAVRAGEVTLVRSTHDVAHPAGANGG
jgi:Flp pilus assembly protein CpaB